MKLFNWIEEQIPTKCSNCGYKGLCFVIDDDYKDDDTTSKFWFREVFGGSRVHVCSECYSK